MIFGYVRFGHTVKCFKTSVVLNLHVNGSFGRFWIELRADTLQSLQAKPLGFQVLKLSHLPVGMDAVLASLHQSL